ncbi:MAG: GAP family protein [Woeseiaceae bacterium]|nr:GAP family protein [Woeseiaceae bacterium]
MLELTLVLIPILLVDAVNPVLFALLVFATTTSWPIANSSALLIGHTIAYFAAGVAVSFGIDGIATRLENPQDIDFAIGSLVGVALVGAFFSIRTRKPAGAPEPAWEPTPLKCFGYGAVVNFIGLPFALPYLGAVSQIVQADLGPGPSLLALGAYNLGYAALFAIVPAAVAVAGERARPFLDSAGSKLERASDFIMPWLILALGLWLIVDAGYFFIVGRPM